MTKCGTCLLRMLKKKRLQNKCLKVEGSKKERKKKKERMNEKKGGKEKLEQRT